MGILQADAKWGEIVSQRLDLEGFWKQILQHAQKTLNQSDINELKTIKSEIEQVAHDRNIIVHGRVHALMHLPPGIPKEHYKTIGPVGDSYDFALAPCWTISKGPHAGKSFLVSATAVKIVRENIQKLVQKVMGFNLRYDHFKGRQPSDKVETNWPKPLS